MSQISVNLDSVPIDVIRKIVSYLDAGHIIYLSQVNRFIRCILVGDNHLWLHRLQYGLKVRINAETRQDPYRTIMKRVRTHQCVDCGIMEVSSQRPFMDSFFNKVLCSNCKQRSIYALINAGTAKITYFLNEDDLLPLHTVSLPNPHHKSASPVRLYSRHQVQKLSERKLALKGITREQRLKLQETRSRRAKVAWEKARRGRARAMLLALKVHGLVFVGGCDVASCFVKGGWRDKRERIRWTVDDIVEHFRQAHEIEIIDVTD